jgi:hypothetical protein
MLDIALKEWAVVCDLLLEGRLALLLRKGGIHESGGPGVFELEHRRFLLFPSWLHQKPQMMADEFRGRVQVVGQEPGTITFQAVGEAAPIWRVPSRTALDRLEGLHPWTAEHLDMRWNYKSENPLYVMAVRTYRVAAPKIVPNTAAYGGCKSWVPLSPADAVDDAGATPILDDAAFGRVVERVEGAMKEP